MSDKKNENDLSMITHGKGLSRKLKHKKTKIIKQGRNLGLLPFAHTHLKDITN